MTAESQSRVPIGTVLDKKYRITREIGRGGMAAVYEAENIDIGKRVAVKVLAAELITSRVVRERFLREARATAAIRSPYICDVYDVGEFEGRPFLVMELLEGESLYDRMTRVRRLDVNLTLDITTQTAKGLAKAHSANIVHRDLKPENLFLTKNEDGQLVAKLLDFGLAKFYTPTGGTEQQARLTREGALFGTPAYMSPEQAKGRGEVDFRSDLWALACIVYECLTGHTVWNVDQGVAMILAQVASAPIPVPSRLRSDLPPNFDLWFKKALSRDPDQRYQSAREFIVALADSLTPDSPVNVHTPSLLVDVDDAVRSRGRVSSPMSSPEPRSAPTPRGSAASGPPISVPRSGPLEASPAGPAGSPAPAEAEPKKRGLGAVRSVAGVMLITAGIAYAYRQDLSASWLRARASATTATSVKRRLAGPRDPIEQEPFAQAISLGQMRLAEGDMQGALSAVEEAIRSGGEGIGTNLRSHLRASQETPDAPCQLKALGRPRPFDIVDPASRPTLAKSSAGLVVAWVDGHEDRNRRQVFTTVLDSALRRIAPARLAAPEPANARFPQLMSVGGRLLLMYWDGQSRQSGIFMRYLDPDGRISSPIRRVAPVGHDEYSPALARDPDGTYWLVWEDDSTDGAEDLLLRHLDARFNALSPVIRLTSLRPDRALRPGAIKPAVVVEEGQLVILFTLRRGLSRRVYLMLVPRGSPALRAGVTASKSGKITEDKFAGRVRPLGAEGSSSDDARVACTDHACFTFWGDDKAGIVAGSLDLATSELLWRHEIAPRGARPYVAATAKRALAAWYDASRVRVAQVTSDGVGTISTIAKVSGIQPFPEVAPGTDPGQWYLAWRDFEAAHYEVMCACIACTSATR